MITDLLAGLLLFAVMALLIRGWRVRRARSVLTGRLAIIERSLPEMIDILRLGVHSGLSVHLLIPTVLDALPAAVRPAFVEVQRRVARGARLGDALEALTVLGDAAHPVLAALRAAAFEGTSLSTSLDRSATEARALRRRRAEQEARRLPVLLLFPLVLCVLPAFVLLAVVPLLVTSLGALSF